MNIVIRTDASTAIGVGHLMRCLTLAEELKDKGAQVLFVSRPLPDNAAAAIKAKHRLKFIPTAVPGSRTPKVLVSISAGKATGQIGLSSITTAWTAVGKAACGHMPEK
jgi:UDP-N-acetylglucosamine:LPS N-acetylglucosamine transferase